MKALQKELRKHPNLAFLTIVLFILIMWEFLGRFGLLDIYYWPLPSQIFPVLFNDLYYTSTNEYQDQNISKNLLEHFSKTLIKWAIGFCFASLIGIIIGFLLGISRTSRALGYHVVNVLRGLPSAAIWPVCGLILGYGWESQYFVIIFGVTWPILLNTANALRSIPREIHDSLSFMKLSQWYKRYVLLICASPGIFTGLEIGCAIAFLLTVTVEIFWPANGGIGWYLSANYQDHNQAQVFAGLLLTAFVGWGLNTFVHLARKKVIFWEEEILSVQHSKFSTLSKKLLAKVKDERLRAILKSNTVTETIENIFKVDVFPNVRYQEHPYMRPNELSRLFDHNGELLQRDIIINVPDEIGKEKTIIFARSWISIGKLNEQFRKHLEEKKMTIGKIVRKMGIPCDYQNLWYQVVVSEKLGVAFGTKGKIVLIQRSRVIKLKGKPTILIHEFIPI